MHRELIAGAGGVTEAADTGSKQSRRYLETLFSKVLSENLKYSYKGGGTMFPKRTKENVDNKIRKAFEDGFFADESSMLDEAVSVLKAPDCSECERAEAIRYLELVSRDLKRLAEPAYDLYGSRF